MWYHAKCIGRDEKQLLKDKKDKKPFYCNWANPFEMFAKKRGAIEDNVHFEKLETKYQALLKTALETNAKTAPKRSKKHQIWWDKKQNGNRTVPPNGLPAVQPPDISFAPNSTNNVARQLRITLYFEQTEY